MSIEETEHKTAPFTNTLIHESSPYLLQHAHNPVHWYPWGEEALGKAKREDKPLIISIGYAACHWCHVMEKECYADTEVAEYMNEHFVAIKIDREERPDIDQIYMNASMLLNGNGGWPLNAFALPNGKPFYVVTYLPREQWLSLLKQIVEIAATQGKEMEEQAEVVTREVAEHQLIKTPRDKDRDELKDLYDSLFKKTSKMIDWKKGGFDKTPKFPLPVAWDWMLQEFYVNENKEAWEAVALTLKEMARGGIYDQIGGGFARYSTDSHWLVPHFEKMLYDNGQLISLFAKAYKISNSLEFKSVIEDTLAFVERELMDEEGGFYSSINADSEGEEGLFYVWDEKEMENILSQEEGQYIIDYFGIQSNGNWEFGKNILARSTGDSQFLERHGLTWEEWLKIKRNAKQKLLRIREKRVRPTTDTKVLLSWNALMLKGLVDAYIALDKDSYLQTAIKNASFIVREMMDDDGHVWRNYMHEKAAIDGMLEDYALFSDACISLYQATLDKHWLDVAQKLVDYVFVHFEDEENPLFYYTSNHAEQLVARKKEVEDNVIPASNSVMANVLFDLGHYLDKETYIQRAKDMLLSVVDEISSAVPYFANWVKLLGKVSYGVSEIAIVGEDYLRKNREIQQRFLPMALFLGGIEENLPLLDHKMVSGETFIYVCEDKVCKQPVMESYEAWKLISKS